MNVSKRSPFGGDVSGWRELQYPDDSTECRVETVQVGCECGWRSPRMRAPIRAEYYPYCVDLHDGGFEDRCYALWKRHIEDVNEDALFDTRRASEREAGR